MGIIRKCFSYCFLTALAFIISIDEGRGQEVDTIPTIKWKTENVSGLPSSVDNSVLKYFPPIISQKGGSCAQASGIGYMFTYEMNRYLDRAADIPENRFSYFYTWNFMNEGKDEGSFAPAGLNIAMSNGVITEKDFPEQKSAYNFYWASGYEKYYNGIHYRVKYFLDMDLKDSADILQIKRYLYDKNEPGHPGGIVNFSSGAGRWEFDHDYQGPSETGYKCMLTKLSETGPHALTIVGYDDLVEFTAPDGSLNKGAFIVVNTHGKVSQDNGHYYLPYWFVFNKKNPSELSDNVTGAYVEYREPAIVFRISLKYTSRNDLSFRLGVSDKASDSAPLLDYVMPIANYQGGDFPMQGNGAPSTIEFGFDFTPHVDKMEDFKNPNYFLTIIKSDRGARYGEGKLISFSVYDYRKNQSDPDIYIYNDINGEMLEKGKNIYNIPTSEVPKCSYSQLQWLDDNGQPLSSPFVLKTAGGKYSKIGFSEYDRKNGTIKVKYVYSPDGNRSLK